MVTLGHFRSSDSLNSNMFHSLFGFEKTWKLQTVFTTAVNLLPGVNFWLSPLPRFGGLYFHLQVLIHSSKFQLGKSDFLQALISSEIFPFFHVVHRMMTKVCLYSHGHCESVHERMVMSWKVFNFIARWNLHNVSIRAWCEAPLVKYLSCQPGRVWGCVCW